VDADHYAALGVDEDATLDEIHEAWRFQLMAFHPDRFRDDGQRERAELLAKRVNAAWQVLGDAAERARYDRTRRARRDEGPRLRELPCPICATLSAVPDQAGRLVSVKCPACSNTFDAVVGGVMIGRPRLEARYLGGRHLLHVRSADGRITSAAARRLPVELALSEGETVSVVFGGRGRGAKYVVVHGRITDLGWRTG
jgi:curved DNA-binding protein CbpA